VLSSRSWLGRLVLIAVIASGSFTAPTVRAEDVATPVAQALFDEGRRLLLEKDYAAACVKFAASQRLEPAAGTLMNLAYCHEQLGKTATAYVEYNDALAASLKANDTERIALARQRIAALEPGLSRLLITLPPGEEEDIVSVTLDGTFVGTDALGAPIPVDLGTHRVTVARAGREVTVDVTVDRPGSTTPVNIPPFAATWARAFAPRRTPSSGATRSTPKQNATPEPIAPMSRAGGANPAVRSAELVITGGVLAISVMSLAAGTLFGLNAFSDWAERNRHCPKGECDQTAVDARDRAARAATLSDTFFALGVATGAVGVYLLVTRPADGGGAHSGQHSEPSERAAVLSAQGRF
jgi:hypothetical protein